jgi:hypothetical protein
MPIRESVKGFDLATGNAITAVRSTEKDDKYSHFDGVLASCLANSNSAAIAFVQLSNSDVQERALGGADINKQTIGAVARMQAPGGEPNYASPRGSQNAEAGERGTSDYGREVITVASEGLARVAPLHLLSNSGSGRRLQARMPTGSGADVEKTRAEEESAFRPSEVEAGKQPQGHSVSESQLGQEAENKYLPNSDGTQWDRMIVGFENNGGNESAKNDFWQRPEAAAAKELQPQTAPVAQSVLKDRSEAPMASPGNAHSRSVLAVEIGRVATANRYGAPGDFPEGSGADEISKCIWIDRALQWLPHAQNEKVASLKVDLETGGSVRANVRVRSGGVEVRMMTDNSRAVQGLTGEVEKLRRSLTVSGLKLDSLEVSYQKDHRAGRFTEQPEQKSRSRSHSADKTQVFTVSGSN